MFVRSLISIIQNCPVNGLVILMTLENYLDNSGLKYDVVSHPYAHDSLDVAEKTKIEPSKIVKCVILEDEGGYVMAVCQASTRIQLGALYREINRRLKFADKFELAAIVPVDELSDVEVVVDNELFNLSDYYLESKNHLNLVHVDSVAFQKIMFGAEHASFSKPALIS